MSIKVKQLGETFFAEVEGVDMTGPLDDTTVADIRAAFNEYGVLLFRGQDIDDAQQTAFSERFGRLEVGPGLLKRGPKIAMKQGKHGVVANMSNVGPDGGLIAPDSIRARFVAADQLWHSDSSFKPVPALASLLHCREIPPEDGETEFADERAGWDALPEAHRRELDGLIVEHDLKYSRHQVGFTEFNQEELDAWPSVQQQLVRTHEETGRKNLYVGSHASRIIKHPDPDAGRALLVELTEHTTQPAFVYRHSWTVGDLVMWDNRCTLHRGRPYDMTKYRRTLHRTTVTGLGPTVVDGRCIDEPSRFRKAA